MRDSSPCLPLNLILILCLFQNGPFPFQSKSYPIEFGKSGKQYCRSCGEKGE
ncbi:unknown [Prevotella sp. CAG:487]|nr:unknown [Prevotella sp. CAG:487]